MTNRKTASTEIEKAIDDSIIRYSQTRPESYDGTKKPVGFDDEPLMFELNHSMSLDTKRKFVLHLPPTNTK